MADLLALAQKMKQEQESAPAPDFSGAAARLKQQQDDEQRQAASFVAWREAHSDVTPEQQTDVLRYAAASGLAPDYVRQNLDTIKKQVDARKTDWLQVAQKHPEVFNLAGDPGRHALIKDDVANLQTIDWSINPLRMWNGSWLVQAPLAALRDATVQQTQTIPRQIAQGSGFGSEDNAAAITDLEKRFGNKDYGERGFLGKAWLGIAKMLPMMAGDLAARGLGSAAARALAAPLGLGAGVGGGAATGGAGAAPAGLGAAAGLSFAGQFAGSFAYNTAMSYGPLSWELGKLKDAEGNPIDPNVAQAIALSASSFNGLLGAGLLGKIGEAIPGVKEALQQANRAAIQKALSTAATRYTLAQGAKDYGEHWLVGASFLAMQQATNAAAVEIGKASVGDPDSSGWRAGEAGFKGFAQGLQDMALLAAAAPTRQLVSDIGRVKASAANAERLQQLVSVAQASKLLERSPADFEAFVSRLSPDAAVYVPAEDFAAHFQARGVDALAAAREMVGDGGRSFVEASATKGDVRIPLSRFALFAKTEHAKALLDDAKLRPEDLTPRQAAAEAERLAGVMKQADAKMMLDPKLAAEFAKGAPPERSPDAPLQAALDAMTPEERAAHDSAKGSKRMVLELQAMMRHFGGEEQGRSVDLPLARASAMHLAEQTPVAALQPGRHLLAERNNAAKAFAAAEAGKMDQAYSYREAQLLAREMHRTTKALKEEMDRAQEFLGRTGRDAWRAQLGLADEGNGLYLEGHDAILKAMGLAEGPSGGRAMQAFDALVSAMEAGDNEPAFDATEVRQLLAEPKPFNHLTVNEVRNLRDAVRQIRFEANNANKVRVGQEKAAVADVVGGIVKDLEALPDQGKALPARSQEGAARETRLNAQAVDAAALNPKLIFEMMGEKAKRFFWDRYLDARKVRNDISGKVLAYIDEHWSKLPKEMQERRYDVVPDLDDALPIPEEVNLAGPRDRSWLWMLALNMGNKSNRERLLGGYHWAADQVLAVLNRPPEEGGLSAEEWKWVESVWKLNDEHLWPLLAEKESQKNGLPPPKIEATPIKTRFGEVSGGYWPAVGDPVAGGSVGQRQAEAGIAGYHSPSYVRASTRKSHTRERAEHAKYVVNLNWSVAPGHVAQVIHDIAFDLPVRDMGRVLEDPALQQAMYRRLGPERALQPKDWLKTVANEQADSVPGAIARVVGLVGGLRNRTVMGAIGGSFSVAAGDITNSLVAISSGDVSVVNGTAATVKTLANPFRAWREARELSPELQNRAQNNTKELRKALGQMGAAGNKGKIGTALEQARTAAFFMNEMVDRLMSTIIWKGAMADAQAKGLRGAEAIRYADDKVFDNLPSFDPAEQSAILRDKRGLGSLLVFHGYFNLLYNKTRRLAHDPYVAAVNAEGVGGVAMAGLKTAAAVGRILGMLAVANVAGEYLSGRGKEDDESTGQWVARKMLAAPFSLIPFGSNIGEPLSAKLVTGSTKKVSIRAAPALSLVQTAMEAVGKIASDEREPAQKVWDAVRLALLGANLPSTQPGKTGEYLTGVATGDKPFGPGPLSGALNLASGTFYGEREGQPSNPLTDLAKLAEDLGF